MTNMEHTELQQIRTDMSDMKGKVDEMYFALMGNKIGKDGGLVGRIEELETTMDEHEKDIQGLKEKNVKMEVYQKIMWTAIGFATASVFSILLSTILK